MATTPTLLSLPLEIRHQIYSYLLPTAVNINIVRDDMDGPLRTSLFRVCRDVFHEAFDYYYSTYTFLLDLTDPLYAPNRFVKGTKDVLKYLRRVQTLQLAIADAFPLGADPCALSEYAREQFDWFLTTLREANENHEGLWLRKLIVLDHCEISASKEITPKAVERGEKRRDVFVPRLEPFKSRIRDIRIESRALSQDRRFDPVRYIMIGIMTRQHSYADESTNDSVTASVWDTVVGVSHMKSSRFPS